MQGLSPVFTRGVAVSVGWVSNRVVRNNFYEQGERPGIKWCTQAVPGHPPPARHPCRPGGCESVPDLWHRTGGRTAIHGRCSLRPAPALQRSGIPLRVSGKLFRKLHRLPDTLRSTPPHFRSLRRPQTAPARPGVPAPLQVVNQS